MIVTTMREYSFDWISMWSTSIALMDRIRIRKLLFPFNLQNWFDENEWVYHLNWNLLFVHVWLNMQGKAHMQHAPFLSFQSFPLLDYILRHTHVPCRNNRKTGANRAVKSNFPRTINSIKWYVAVRHSHSWKRESISSAVEDFNVIVAASVSRVINSRHSNGMWIRTDDAKCHLNRKHYFVKLQIRLLQLQNESVWVGTIFNIS